MSSKEDNSVYNEIYEIIRLGNVEQLKEKICIRSGNDNYSDILFNRYYDTLSQAYEDLNIKNVVLIEDMKVFVENRLISFHYSYEDSQQDLNDNDSLDEIKTRVNSVIGNINLLFTEYSNTKKVDDKFILVAKFIVQNINVLKRQLKITYDKLPWEEIEFCLSSFVSSQINRKEINLFYCSILNKDKIIYHLKNFSTVLKDISNNMHVNELVDLSKLKREKIVAEIVKKYPEFNELYDDHQQIKDMYSLQKINDYLKLALSADAKKREGQLIIIRCLHVISECLKNTLQYPNLSLNKSELLLMILPHDVRKVVLDLRNALSYSYSLYKRNNIEQYDVDFFNNVKNHFNRLYEVITDFLYKNKTKTIRMFLKKIADSQSRDEIKEITDIFCNCKLSKLNEKDFIMMTEYKKLIKLVKEVTTNKTWEKTESEKMLFNDIENKMFNLNTTSKIIRKNYITMLTSLNGLEVVMMDDETNSNIVRDAKYFANIILEITTPKIDTKDLINIAEISLTIFHNISARLWGDYNNSLKRLICEVCFITEHGTKDLKSLKHMKDTLGECNFFPMTYYERKTYDVTKEKYKDQLALKLLELNSELEKNSMNDDLIRNLYCYKRNKKLLCVLEILILDIMSILDFLKDNVSNDLILLDEDIFLLTSKGLFNHLAHDNSLNDIFLIDPSMVIVSNAVNLIENASKCENIGKFLTDNADKVNEKYERSLMIITNQTNMFTAIEAGDIEELKNTIRKGADINARSINSWGALHFAASGSGIDVIKYIFDQISNVNVIDMDGQTPFHIAATYGRINIVEFFIKRGINYIDVSDNRQKTPLHIASQNGHKDIVEILIANNADVNALDMAGFSPLYYAVKENYIEIANMILDKGINIGIVSKISTGIASLHTAAERNYMEIISLLLKNCANINIKNGKDETPLHVAVLNGHIKVVTALIIKGADINCKTTVGNTALHYASEKGHDEIVDILLKHGAEVNAINFAGCTPLHFAAKNGHETIVKSLMENKADVNIVNIMDKTTLHFAAGSGNLKIVSFLIEHGVDIHAKTKFDFTALHYACESGYKDVAQFLIEKGINIYIKNIKGQSAFYSAVLSGQKDIVELLIRNKVIVNAQNVQGDTPLHAAVKNGSKDVVDLLIKNNAKVNTKNKMGATPLLYAVNYGHYDITELLIKHKATVNLITETGITLLQVVITKGNKDILNLLIKNLPNADGNDQIVKALDLAIEAGAVDIVIDLLGKSAENMKCYDLSQQLSIAMKHNYKDIVEILIKNGADVNGKDGMILLQAVYIGRNDILEILLKNGGNARVRIQDQTLLHLAASTGIVEIVNTLIEWGAEVDVTDISKITPLQIALQNAHEDISEIFLEHIENIEFTNMQLHTPLHMAASCGCSDIVKLLLSKGAQINVKDARNETPLELAVKFGHLQVVKILLEHIRMDMNNKVKDFSELSSLQKSSESVKHPVINGSENSNGSSSGSVNSNSSAPSNNTALCDKEPKPLDLNEPTASGNKLLHYATLYNRSQVIKYFLSQGIDVNSKDSDGRTCMHIAADNGNEEIIEILLNNGAVYNPIDNLEQIPLSSMAKDDGFILLPSTDELFKAVKENDLPSIRKHITEGAFVNAKDIEGYTALHYATKNGFDRAVKILLLNKANPNSVDNDGLTPLHYAVKLANLEIVKILLSHGAIYNVVSKEGKTPLDLTTGDGMIFCILGMIEESFEKIKDNDATVVDDLNSMLSADTLRAIMCACNTENRSLVVAAVHNNFSEIELLKQVWQPDHLIHLKNAFMHFSQGNYSRALNAFRRIYKTRSDILGADNPGTLNIQVFIGKVLYKQRMFQVALNTLEEVFEKQKETLGSNHKDTLNTQSTIAMVLHAQGKMEEAFDIYQEVYYRQKKVLGSNHLETLNTRFHQTLLLNKQGKYKEALIMGMVVYEKRVEVLGENDIATISALNNIAMILSNQGRYDESLKILRENVLIKQKMVLGVNHVEVIKTVQNIAALHTSKHSHFESLTTLQEVLNTQIEALPENHSLTLITKYNIGNLYYKLGYWVNAHAMYVECHKPGISVFGPKHPFVLHASRNVKIIEALIGCKCSDEENMDSNNAQENINTAEDPENLHQSLSKDAENGNKHNIDRGADPKGCNEVAKVSLEQRETNFIDESIAPSGSTALHIAVEKGSLETVLCLLEHGTTFNSEDKEGKMPIDYSKDQKITKLLKLIEELFENTKNGNVKVLNKLRELERKEFVAITKTRDKEGNTLLKAAIINKHKNVAKKLVEMIKNN